MARTMKDSGIEWIGKIPIDKETIRLKYIADITTGNMDTQNKNNEGIYPFYVRSPIIEHSDDYSFDDKEAILMAGDGVGAGRVFHLVSGKYGCHQRVYRLNNFKGVISKFLKYYLEVVFPMIMDYGSAKSTVDSVRLPMIQSVDVVMFDMKEQQRIVDFLDDKVSAIEAIISLTKKSIEEYKLYKQAVITEAVTKGLDYFVPMKDSGIEWIGQIPATWKLIPLKYKVFLNQETLSETTEKEYEFDYIEIGSVNLQEGIKQYEHIKFVDAPSRARRIVKKNDIIVSTVRTYLKAIAQVPDRTDLVASTGFAVLTPHDIYADYLAYMIKTDYFTETVTSNSVGVSYPAINASELIGFKIIFPSENEQIEIARFLDAKCTEIDVLITKKESFVEEMEAYKKSLIYEYVTGKKEVL